MSDPPVRSTRGHGLLEPLLARLRARQADRLIPAALRQGRILDIGCGSYPYFLAHTSFREKYAIDQLSPAGVPPEIRWHTLDLNSSPQLPFEDAHFAAVTLLAVAEHLEPASLVTLLGEVRRVLAPGGRTVLTTPPPWSDRLLHLMAKVGLVSAEEIAEHTYAYDQARLGWCLGRAGFDMDKLELGYFELRWNLWATADR